MIECLDSRLVVEERTGKTPIGVIALANYFRIDGGKLKQFRINPVQGRRMKPIPDGTAIIEVEYERHSRCTCYTVRCLDARGNNLKTYNI